MTARSSDNRKRERVTVYTTAVLFRIALAANEDAGYIDESETTGESIAEVQKAIKARNALIDSDGNLVLVEPSSVVGYRFERV